MQDTDQPKEGERGRYGGPLSPVMPETQEPDVSPELIREYVLQSPQQVIPGRAS